MNVYRQVLRGYEEIISISPETALGGLAESPPLGENLETGQSQQPAHALPAHRGGVQYIITLERVEPKRCLHLALILGSALGGCKGHHVCLQGRDESLRSGH